jgi:hypothetical protein
MSLASLLSFGASQLGVPTIGPPFGKRPEFSAETILLGIQFVVFGVGAWYLRQIVAKLPDQIEACKFSTPLLS